jgi:hypothetical protein
MSYPSKNSQLYVGPFLPCLGLSWKFPSKTQTHILVGGLDHFLFSIVYEIILPID